MHVLAHRGYLRGPDAQRENRREALAECLARGFGIETDIRRTADGRFYVSHDPAALSPENAADAHAPIFRAARAPIALNVKEVGHERALIEFLTAHELIDRVFLFDMELVEDVPGETARTLRRLHPTVSLTARVSDRGETVERALAIGEASVIWLDEFDRLWAEEKDVARLKRAGKVVHAVSPELHGFPLEVAQKRWEAFHAWGVDGICTDFPEALAAWYKTRSRP